MADHHTVCLLSHKLWTVTIHTSPWRAQAWMEHPKLSYGSFSKASMPATSPLTSQQSSKIARRGPNAQRIHTHIRELSSKFSRRMTQHCGPFRMWLG